MLTTALHKKCGTRLLEPHMDCSNVHVMFFCSLRRASVSLFLPELVKNLECNIHTSKHTRCSWIPVSGHSPSFFYEYEFIFLHYILCLHKKRKFGCRSKVIPKLLVDLILSKLHCNNSTSTANIFT